MNKPFLEVLTRHYTLRPRFLEKNRASLAALTSSDWVHTLLVDGVGIGVPAMNLVLRDVAPNLIGKWIWILDDDDICLRPTLIEELRAVSDDKDVIMMRVDCETHVGRIIPSESWGTSPIFADVSMSSFVVRNDIYQQFAYAFPESIGADFAFISEVFAHVPNERIAWLDVVAAKTLQNGQGRPE